MNINSKTKMRTHKQMCSTTKKLCVLFLLVLTILLVSAVFVDAIDFKNTFSGASGTLSKVSGGFKKFKKFVTLKRLLSYGAVGILLLLIGMLSPLKDRFSNDSQKYVMWFLILVIAIVITNSALKDKDEYIWEQPFALSIRAKLFGCDTAQTKVCQPQVDKYGAGGYHEIIYDRTGQNPQIKVDDKLGIFRTGNNGAGFPTLAILFVSMLLFLSLFKDKVLVDGFYIEYWLPALLAFLIANDGMESKVALVIGGWLVVLAFNAKYSDNTSTDSKGGFVFGFIVAIVQLLLTQLDGSLIYTWFEEADSTISLISITILGIVAGFMKNLMSQGGTDRWNDDYERLTPKNKEKVDQLEKEGQPIKAWITKKGLGWLPGMKTQQLDFDLKVPGMKRKKLAELTGKSEKEIKEHYAEILATLPDDQLDEFRNYEQRLEYARSGEGLDSNRDHEYAY
ncbi:hypothetical protein HON01_08585 [Candidatus Woesearchaeota archaeon]|nr:hypothetical protein [Candidatus Woesearchaeota archaeon]MBT7368359.1 hypothetical protein [Candidatus Woesearchaeota archaeon]